MPGGRIGGDHLVEHSQHRLVERDVDELPLAGTVPVLQRGERPERPERAREVIRNGRRAGRYGRTVRIAGDVADAAHRARDATESRTVAVRARLTVRRDPHHDEARVDGAEIVPAEPPALHGAGPEVLGEDVGACGETFDERLTLRRTEVARDRFLVARLDQPPERDPARGRRPEPAEVVTRSGLLDLDHLGAELAEERAAERGGHKRSEVEDGQAF